MNNGAEILLLMMMLILPLSALVARRLPLDGIAKLAALWVMIFALVTAAIVLWNGWGTGA